MKTNSLFKDLEEKRVNIEPGCNWLVWELPDKLLWKQRFPTCTSCGGNRLPKRTSSCSCLRWAVSSTFQQSLQPPTRLPLKLYIHYLLFSRCAPSVFTAKRNTMCLLLIKLLLPSLISLFPSVLLQPTPLHTLVSCLPFVITSHNYQRLCVVWVFFLRVKSRCQQLFSVSLHFVCQFDTSKSIAGFLVFLGTSPADVLSHPSVIHRQGPRLGYAMCGEKFISWRGSAPHERRACCTHISEPLTLGKRTENLWIIKGLVSYCSQTAGGFDVLLPWRPQNQSTLWRTWSWHMSLTGSREKTAIGTPRLDLQSTRLRQFLFVSQRKLKWVVGLHHYVQPHVRFSLSGC